MPQPMFKKLEHDGLGFLDECETMSVDGDQTCTHATVDALLHQHQALEQKIDACAAFHQCILNALHHLSVQMGNKAMIAECAPKSTVSNLTGRTLDVGLTAGTFNVERRSSTCDSISRERWSWSEVRAKRKKRALEKGMEQYEQRSTDSDADSKVVDRRPLRTLFRDSVEDQSFDLVFGGIIVLNALCLGVQVEIRARNSSETIALDVLDVLEYVFSCCFFVELGCRIIAAGLPFFYNKDWTWNLFDFLVVACSFMDIVARILNLNAADIFQNLSIIRVIRAIRIIRVIRVLRLFNFFRPLRILVYAIAHTLRQCFWAWILLTLLLYVFGIVFCQVATDYKQDCDRDQSPECKKTADSLNEYYRSLSTTFGTLFMAVTGGIDWKAASLALLDIGWVYCMLFVCYITFVLFAMMNVVTGLFCQTALESVQADTDNVIAEKMKRKAAYTSALQKLCSEIDESGDGQISINEFIVLADDARLNSVLKSIDIDVEDAWLLFEMLDIREAGVIEIDDFVEGCLRLKGQAKGVHIHQLLYENRWIMSQLSDIHHLLDPRLPLKKTRAGSMDLLGSKSVHACAKLK